MPCYDFVRVTELTLAPPFVHEQKAALIYADMIQINADKVSAIIRVEIRGLLRSCAKGGVLGTPGSLDVTGGEYRTRERIHRGIADPRLLAIPAS